MSPWWVRIPTGDAMEFRKCLFRWIPVFEIISIQFNQTGVWRRVGWMKKSWVNEEELGEWRRVGWMKKGGEQSYGAVCTCCFSSISFTAAPVSAHCCNNWCVFWPQNCGAGSNLGVSVSLATNPAHPLVHNPEYPQSLGKMQNFPRIHSEVGGILANCLTENILLR